MRTVAAFIVFGTLLFSCKQKHESPGNGGHHSHETYSPGLGDYMLKMQTRHAKLWFAGINENWELADFQIHEMEEILEDLEKYKSEEEEVKLLPMIKAPLDSVDAAVDAKNPKKFKSTYENLTASCNSCHIASKHAYNVVKTPDSPMFSNQEFTPQKEQR